MNEKRLLILIFIFALVVRLIFLYSHPLKIWDETIYSNLAYDISKGNSYSFVNGWSDFMPCGNDGNYCWPKAGFRAPLLPYLLSLFYLFRLDFLAQFFIPFLGALSCILLYFIGKKMFNKEVALYSSLILALIPLHVVNSSYIFADILSVFLVLIVVLAFWNGYELGNKKYKVLFGFFLALALLSKYTLLWVFPVFLAYFLIKKENFLKDKYFYCSILAFFITLIPLFVYSQMTYNNIFGAFIHGSKASSYWGGEQVWYFFLQYSWNMLSIISAVFILSLIYIIYKKEWKRRILFSLILVFVFVFFASIMPHKEERYILPVIPFICLISAFFIEKIKKSRIIIAVLLLILLFSCSTLFVSLYTKTHTPEVSCFLEGNKFLRGSSGVVLTEESPVTYYYSRLETRYYPNPWNVEAVKNMDEIYDNVYFLLSDFNIPNEKALQIKQDLKDFKEIFNCENKTIVYKLENN